MAIEPAINCPIDCGVAITSEFARQFTKQTVAKRTADLDFFVEYKQLSSGSSESVLLGDINYTRNTYPTSATNIRAIIEYLPEKFSSVDSIKSGDVSILADPVPEDPLLLEYQADGTTSVEVTFNTNEKIRKSVTTFTLAESVTQDIFQNFESGSLGRHIYDQIRQYADGSTSAPNHYPIYSTFDFSSNNYVKNAGHWASGLDFSGLMVNKSGSAGVTNVSAITPHHAIGVSHYPPEVGDILYFCDSNNQTVSRTVQSRQFVSNQDCVVVKFNEALPNTVKKYKTLPSSFLDYFPINKNAYSVFGVESSYRGSSMPIIVCSHYRWDAEWPLQRSNRYAYIYQTTLFFTGLNSETVAFVPAWSDPNNFPDYNGVLSGIRGGDSGSPCFFVINNDLVLVHCHTSGGGGAMLPSFLSSIQSVIDSLGPSGQTFETVDLSGFTNFSS